MEQKHEHSMLLLAMVAIVAIVAVVLLVQNNDSSSTDISEDAVIDVYDEDGNLIGEGFKSRRKSDQRSTTKDSGPRRAKDTYIEPIDSPVLLKTVSEDRISWKDGGSLMYFTADQANEQPTFTDGYPDYLLDHIGDAKTDFDGDGLTNKEEYEKETNPREPTDTTTTDDGITVPTDQPDENGERGCTFECNCVTVSKGVYIECLTRDGEPVNSRGDNMNFYLCGIEIDAAESWEVTINPCPGNLMAFRSACEEGKKEKCPPIPEMGDVEPCKTNAIKECISAGGVAHYKPHPAYDGSQFVD